MFGFGKKESKPKKYPTYEILHHFEGLAQLGWAESCTVDILLNEKELKFSWKKKEVILPFNQLESVQLLTWRKTRVRPANSAGRALVGGLVGGDTGFMLGALSAQNEMVTKDVTIRPAIKICYFPYGEHRNTQHIILGPSGASAEKSVRLFAEAICYYAGIDGPEIIPDKPERTYL